MMESEKSNQSKDKDRSSTWLRFRLRQAVMETPGYRSADGRVRKAPEDEPIDKGWVPRLSNNENGIRILVRRCRKEETPGCWFSTRDRPAVAE
ncbi:hypothetical protein Y032_0560g3459 [Ancylostoma ceylanicum]|uniref:Uncharacterized protein n=1 Tax=Ancylostoma ceylanicum TaxID=53326 RepID=A0A016WPR6_9BILA|nr:hypothetical protein Y032_0560g3459 [Ancylostoma ceylanicum]